MRGCSKQNVKLDRCQRIAAMNTSNLGIVEVKRLIWSILRPRVNLAYQRADFARALFVNDARTSRKFLEGERARAPCVNDARIFWGKFCSGNDGRLKFSELSHFQIFARLSNFCPIIKFLPDFQNFVRFSKFCLIFKILPNS